MLWNKKRMKNGGGQISDGIYTVDVSFPFLDLFVDNLLSLSHLPSSRLYFLAVVTEIASLFLILSKIGDPESSATYSACLSIYINHRLSRRKLCFNSCLISILCIRPSLLSFIAFCLTLWIFSWFLKASVFDIIRTNHGKKLKMTKGHNIVSHFKSIEFSRYFFLFPSTKTHAYSSRLILSFRCSTITVPSCSQWHGAWNSRWAHQPFVQRPQSNVSYAI